MTTGYQGWRGQQVGRAGRRRRRRLARAEKKGSRSPLAEIPIFFVARARLHLGHSKKRNSAGWEWRHPPNNSLNFVQHIKCAKVLNSRNNRDDFFVFDISYSIEMRRRRREKIFYYLRAETVEFIKQCNANMFFKMHNNNRLQ